MFVMFINDLINTLEEFGVSAKLFAYDVKMYVRVLSNCDVSRLQR